MCRAKKTSFTGILQYIFIRRPHLFVDSNKNNPVSRIACCRINMLRMCLVLVLVSAHSGWSYWITCLQPADAASRHYEIYNCSAIHNILKRIMVSFYPFYPALRLSRAGCLPHPNAAQPAPPPRCICWRGTTTTLLLFRGRATLLYVQLCFIEQFEGTRRHNAVFCCTMF